MADEVGEDKVGKRKVGKRKVGEEVGDGNDFKVVKVDDDVVIVVDTNQAENDQLRYLIAQLKKDVKAGVSIAGHYERLRKNDPVTLRSGPPNIGLWIEMSDLEKKLRSQDSKARAALKCVN